MRKRNESQGSQRSGNRGSTKDAVKVKPEVMWKTELDRIKKEYADVAQEPGDLSNIYEAAAPDYLKSNNFHMTTEEFDDFKKYHMKMKRQLEMDIIKGNKKMDIVNQIAKMAEDDTARLAKKQNR